MSTIYSYPSSRHSHRSHSHSRSMSESRGPVYISSGSSHGSSRYHAGSSYGGSYSYPERERYASVTTLHRPPLPRSKSLTSLVGEPSITVIPPTRSKSRSELGYEPQYTEDGKLTVATMIRRLFGLGPKPVSTVKVYEGSNSLFPKLRRKSSKSSSRYVYPTSYAPRQPVQAVYRTH
ncbi:unnamed protein product [Rhizoctonia solani]|uniref:Uncharacterized protein n=1 Tax=Rhizoctonia solani TaxID=456999 RepID=A0A8H3GMH5_9AGAM|nr:unnamed protein product [Rhizoctonia solani]CAE6457462.1 unnamed protein product [Rhizoctonia solani]